MLYIKNQRGWEFNQWRRKMARSSAKFPEPALRIHPEADMAIQILRLPSIHAQTHDDCLITLVATVPDDGHDQGAWPFTTQQRMVSLTTVDAMMDPQSQC
jgi:hypothetical protein